MAGEVVVVTGGRRREGLGCAQPCWLGGQRPVPARARLAPGPRPARTRPVIGGSGGSGGTRTVGTCNVGIAWVVRAARAELVDGRYLGVGFSGQAAITQHPRGARANGTAMRRAAPSRRRPTATILVGIGMLGVAGAIIARPVAAPAALVGWMAAGFVLAGASQLLLARGVWGLRIVAGTIWLASALTVLWWPDPTTLLLARTLGAGLLVVGGVDLVVAVGLPRTSNLRFAAAAGGFAHAGLGLAVLRWPSISAFTLGVAVSLWLLLLGIRVVVQGADRLRAGDAPEVVASGRWSPKARVLGSTAMLVVSAIAVVAALVVQGDTTPNPGPFYATPASFDPTPGTLLRTEVIDAFVEGATAYRVLYTSRDLHDDPVTKTGVVIVPDGPDPQAGDRPILAHTHGTIGIDRSCAPSLLGSAYAKQLWGLEEFIAAGWIIAAPDYLGLGGEGDHPYLVGATAATGTLDIVRAAIEFDQGAPERRFAVAGHSQGGHAALFTGQRASAYAPELELVGVAGIAPASELAAFIEANDGTLFGNLLGAYAVAAWDRVFDDIDAESIVDAAVLPIVQRLARTCVAIGPEAFGLMIQAELLHLGFLVSSIWETEPWASRIADNTPGNALIDAPLLIVQGDRDSLIRPDIQRRFVDRLCTSGQQVEYREIAGAGHLDVDDTAAGMVVDWLTDRLTDAPAVSACATE